MARRGYDPNRLQKAQIVKANADQQHDEALVDQVTHVVYGGMEGVERRLDTIELDLQLLNKKLDMIMERIGVGEREAQA